MIDVDASVGLKVQRSAHTDCILFDGSTAYCTPITISRSASIRLLTEPGNVGIIQTLSMPLIDPRLARASLLIRLTYIVRRTLRILCDNTWANGIGRVRVSLSLCVCVCVCDLILSTTAQARVFKNLINFTRPIIIIIMPCPWGIKR